MYSDATPRFARRPVIVLIMSFALIVSVAGAVYASHQFSDVSNTHPFHDEIGAIADAGITTGYDDGTYRPGTDVTRQAMAAFMERGFGRVAFSETSTSLSSDESTVLTTVSVDAGATGGGNGFVLVTGHLEGNTGNAAACPCQLNLTINDVGTGTTANERVFVQLPGQADESGFARVDATAQQVYLLPADSTGEYNLTAWLNDSDGSANVSAELTAVYVPFGPDGDNTLIYGD